MSVSNKWVLVHRAESTIRKRNARPASVHHLGSRCEGDLRGSGKGIVGRIGVTRSENDARILVPKMERSQSQRAKVSGVRRQWMEDHQMEQCKGVISFFYKWHHSRFTSASWSKCRWTSKSRQICSFWRRPKWMMSRTSRQPIWMESLVWRYDVIKWGYKRCRFKFEVRQAINDLNNIASEAAVEVWKDSELYGRNLFFLFFFL